MVKSRYIGDGHPTFNRNPYNGHINPYYWVDDHPLLYGNNVSLDPGKNNSHSKVTLFSLITPFLALRTTMSAKSSREALPANDFFSVALRGQLIWGNCCCPAHSGNCGIPIICMCSSGRRYLSSWSLSPARQIKNIFPWRNNVGQKTLHSGNVHGFWSRLHTTAGVYCRCFSVRWVTFINSGVDIIAGCWGILKKRRQSCKQL